MDMAEEWVSELEMLAILAGSRRVSRHWWSTDDGRAWLVGVIAAARQGSTARDGTAHSS
jgi:hypothetical protein